MKKCGIPLRLDDREAPWVERRLDDAGHTYTRTRMVAGDIACVLPSGLSLGIERKTWQDLIGACRQRQQGGMRFLKQVQRLIAAYDIPVILMEGGYRIYKTGHSDIGELDAHGTVLGGLSIAGGTKVAPGGLYLADAALMRAQHMGAWVTHCPEPELFGDRIHYLVSYIAKHSEEFTRSGRDAANPFDEDGSRG